MITVRDLPLSDNFYGWSKAAYELLSEEVLRRSSIVYIQVTFDESNRRNEARYQAALAHSILAHRLPDEALQRFSAQQDFLELVDGRDEGFLELRGVQVPFVVIHNAPELHERGALDARYAPRFQKLWELQQRR